MRGKYQLAIGLAAAVSQIISVAYIFWVINGELGPAQLGLWALILSSLSIVNVSGFGLGQAMIHFTQHAKEHPGNPREFEHFFRTAITLTLIGAAILGAVIFFPARFLILDLAEPEQHGLVKAMLPLMMVSLVAALLNRLMVATLNGQGQFWVGQVAIILGSALYIGLAMAWVGPFQLLGVAYAHLAMTVAVLVLGWAGVVLIRAQEGGGFDALWPIGLYRHTVRPMIKLGVSFQVTSILILFIEPLARFTLGYAGGLASVGFYEMANRLVTTPRELVARPAAYYGGRFAALNRSDKPGMLALYNLSLKRFWTLGGLGFVGLLIVVVPVADYWVQERHPFFFFAVGVLGIGMGFSIPAIVPWFWGIGTGNNGYNLRSIGIMVVASLVACGFATVFTQPYLVPLGVCLGMVLGQIYLIRSTSIEVRKVGGLSDGTTV